MPKAKIKLKTVLLPRIPQGARVKVLRPNLWAGISGVVDRHTPEFNVIRVRNHQGAEFEIGALAHELEIIPQEAPDSLQ